MGVRVVVVDRQPLFSRGLDNAAQAQQQAADHLRAAFAGVAA